MLRALAIVLSVILCSSSGARALGVEQVENPQTTHSGWVTDQARLLDTATAAKIEARFSKLKADSGAEVALVIVPTIDGQSPRVFATALFQRWKVGREGHDDGALVLHVQDQRRVEIETGYGLEGVMPDALCAWLLNDAVAPLFREGEFARGHEALSAGISYAVRHPGVGHDPLIRAALSAVDVDGEQIDAILHPPEGPNWRVIGWAFLAALCVRALRVLAHRRYHRGTPGRSLRWYGWSFAIFMASCTAPLTHYQDPSPPLIFLSLASLFTGIQAIRYQRKARQRYAVSRCGACQEPRELLPRAEADAFLNAGQLTEVRIRTRDYDVFRCACGAEPELRQLDAGESAARCPACHFLTDQKLETRTLREASYAQGGLVEERFRCAHCAKERSVQRETSARARSEDRSSSGSSSSSSNSGGGGSFGGGRSGGGGAGMSY